MAISDNVVWVYRYKYWDPAADEMVMSWRRARLEAIRDGLGIPVLESGVPIPRAFLDEQGWASGAAGRKH
jgi:hypothetical protein